MDYAEPTGAVGDGDVDVEEVLKLISMVTVLSLGAVLAIILAAYSLSRAFLPRNTSLKIRLLFIWHIFDAMVHFALEGSYLFHCFFSWAPFPLFDDLPYVTYFPVPMTPYGVAFKGESGRLYGSFYSNAPMAKLWQEYARADRRWGGTDLTIISLELLTVFVMAPLSIYICHLLRKQDMGKAWLVMIVVATGELYGGGLPDRQTQFVTLTPRRYRIYDLCAGVAYMQPQSGHFELDVPLAVCRRVVLRLDPRSLTMPQVPYFLQCWALGPHTLMGAVGSLWRRGRSVRSEQRPETWTNDNGDEGKDNVNMLDSHCTKVISQSSTGQSSQDVAVSSNYLRKISAAIGRRRRRSSTGSFLALTDNKPTNSKPTDIMWDSSAQEDL